MQARQAADLARTAARDGAVAAPSGNAVERAKGYARQALSEATLRAYAADWAHYAAWCRAEGCEALPAPPATIAAYLASMARTHGRSTLRRRLAAIGQQHRIEGADWMPEHPAIRATLRGILRQHGTPPRRAAALGTAEIRRLVATCAGDLVGLRDRALLLLGFAGALRRAELVAVRREHLAFTPAGLILLVPRSKADPEGQGAEIGISSGTYPDTCPVRALRTWLEALGGETGPVFRGIDQDGVVGDQAMGVTGVRHILRERVARAGLKLGALERISPHSLRAGCITELKRQGAPDELVMRHSRHRSLMTMLGYNRRAELRAASATKLLGL